MHPSRSFHLLIAILVLGLATSALAASKTDKLAQLEQQVSALEQKLAALEASLQGLSERLASFETQLADATRSDAEKEEIASQRVGQINNLISAGNYDAARKEIAELQKKFGSTRAAVSVRRLEQELMVIGKESPTDLGIEKWFQGNGVDLAQGKATVLVFWEVWCPHCKREVPKLEALYGQYKDRGLQLVGLTKLSRSATEEQVVEFLQSSKVSYPIAKENGQASSYFNVTSIPAAAVVKDGKVVWRGHPNAINDAMLKGWL
jgi:thiol-disulfide isomerase/thioredoxin